MTPLGRVLRTTAVKLSLVYLVLTALIATALLTVIAYQTRAILQEQIEAALDAELSALDGIYRLTGMPGLVRAVEARAAPASPTLYLVTTPLGQPVAGNVAAVEPGALDRAMRGRIGYTPEMGDGEGREALVQIFVLPGGVRLLVGRDLADEVRVRDLVVRAGIAAAGAVLLLGVGGGWFMARRVARRIDAMSETSRTIMAGDLSRRLPLAGTGDEFDRLAQSVNAALARIEMLMRGLKGVTDDIAHDLKTPLTRMRARVEEALRSGDPATMRTTLERALDDTDGLIRTFDALLRIARTEGGAGKEGFADLDLTEVAAGVAELYAAVADDAGLSLRLDAPNAPVRVRGHRELLAQALANLVDNAVKYAGQGEIVLSIAREGCDAVATVTDQGPGIPAADRDRVLDRFVRLEASRSQPGSGLGLSLVAAVARLHDGAITFDDAKPGLRAVLRLPISAWDQRP